MIQVQRLPYIEPTNPLDHFDLHQFKRNKYASSQDTLLAFSDLRTMQVSRHLGRCRRWIPPFTASDEKLRRVIILKCWQVVHAGNSFPPEGITLEELRRIVNSALKTRLQCPHGQPGDLSNWNDHVQRITLRRYDYVQLQTLVAYRAWRLGHTSVDIAAALGITPYNVRVILWRLCACAEKLGYEVAAPNKTKGRKYSRKRIWTSQRMRRVLDARSNGTPYSKIAARMGFNTANTVMAAVLRHQAKQNRRRGL